jgi:hypothetical protein
MWHPSDLEPSVKRRSFLGLAAATLGFTASKAPSAHQHATLNAPLDVQAYETGQFNDVYRLTYEMTNHDSEPVMPAPTVWGVGRQTQHPWAVESGPEPLAVGATGTYTVHAPGHHEAVRVHPDKPAQLTVYDIGREARAIQQFTATTDARYRGTTDA